MKFEDYKNRQPFKVPQNYFEELNDNIMKMLPEEPAKRSCRKINWMGRFAYMSYAAMIVIIFVLSTVLINKSNKFVSSDTASIENIDTEYIDDILNNYPIDDYTFYCCLTGNETNF